MYLAEGTVLHFEEGALAFAAHLQVIGGVDDLDAEVQSLEKKLRSEPGLNHLLRQDAGGGAERPHAAARRPHAFGEARGQVARSRVDEAAVDGREESVEELLHRLVDAELGARQEETDHGEEFAHGPGCLGGHAAVGLAEEDVGEVLRLPHQGLEGVCGMDSRRWKDMSTTHTGAAAPTPPLEKSRPPPRTRWCFNKASASPTLGGVVEVRNGGEQVSRAVLGEQSPKAREALLQDGADGEKRGQAGGAGLLG